MKIYISADMEGIAGTTSWDEVDNSKPDYNNFKQQMSDEVLAACQGAIKAGATEIVIKDAHESGRNILAKTFPQEVKFINGWSGHPFSMMQEIESNFDAAIMVGYHSRANANTNPLSHTMNSLAVTELKINEQFASEFLINAYTAAYVGVPVVFLSGDEGICKEVRDVNLNIKTVAVKQGVGNSTISIHPDLAIHQIKKGVENALGQDLEVCKLKMPDKFSIVVEYCKHTSAYQASFYPGAQQISPSKIFYEAHDYFDVLRFFKFNLG